MTTTPTTSAGTAWNFARARRAAAEVRAAESGRTAVATARPRGPGVLRSRAPLAIMLYVAAQDGLVVEHHNGGFVVLRAPVVAGADRSGGYRLRVLRALDRHWDLVVFVLPAALCLTAGALLALVFGSVIAALVAVLLGLLWITTIMVTTVLSMLATLLRFGQPPSAARSLAAELLSGYHWYAPLVHQPDTAHVDTLLGLAAERLRRLLLAQAGSPVRGKMRLSGKVTETLVVLTSGVTSMATRDAINHSLRAMRDQPPDGGAIVLAAPNRVDDRPDRPVIGGGFIALYLVAVAAVVFACAGFVASDEATACAGSCAGRPATYTTAVWWLAQRLLPLYRPDFTPATPTAALFGGLVSVLAVTGVFVAFVAGQQAIRRNRQAHHDHDERVEMMNRSARTLILVATETERTAVLVAVRERTGEAPVTDTSGPRTAFRLGWIGATEILLAQATEAGVVTAGAMMMTAQRLIDHLEPDYVILTGICFGLRPDEGQELGDIVVARRVHSVDQKKVEETRTVQRGVNVGVSPLMLDRFQAAQVDWDGPRVHIGTILTSSTLVNSRALVDELRERFPDAIAGEMEGVGVSEAAKEEIKPDWIVVKAISDWGYDKTDEHQVVAAGNVARFVTTVLASNALNRRR